MDTPKDGDIIHLIKLSQSCVWYCDSLFGWANRKQIADMPISENSPRDWSKSRMLLSVQKIIWVVDFDNYTYAFSFQSISKVQASGKIHEANFNYNIRMTLASQHF